MASEINLFNNYKKFVYLKKVKVKMLQNYEKPENLQLINKYSK